MKPFYGHSEDVAALVAEMLGFDGFGPCQAIGVLNRDGLLIGGAVFHDWNPKAGVIEMSAASAVPNWATRTVVREIFGYPFRIGCQLLVARTSERNPAPLKLWRTLGADEFRIPRLGGRDEAMVITTLTAEAWAKSRFSGTGTGRHRQGQKRAGTA